MTLRKTISIIDDSEFEFEIEIQDLDYKTEQLMHDAIQNLQNVRKWLYLGADISNREWVKIGITTGDLRSRSYSSANPNYYIFCAFQFNYNVTMKEMRRVELDMHNKFDRYFISQYGSSRRLNHFESGRPSECYCPVDFLFVLEDLHYELFHNYSLYFSKIGYENEIDDIDGATVRCEFSPTLPKKMQNKLLNRLMQW